jgi:hypothetical protein
MEMTFFGFSTDPKIEMVTIYALQIKEVEWSTLA